MGRCEGRGYKLLSAEDNIKFHFAKNKVDCFLLRWVRCVMKKFPFKNVNKRRRKVYQLSCSIVSRSSKIIPGHKLLPSFTQIDVCHLFSLARGRLEALQWDDTLRFLTDK